MSSKLKINLLGPMHVMIDEKTAVFRTDALRVLLAYLAAHQGTPQRRDTLAGLLSPDRPDKEALTYLRNRLTRLRKAIGDENANPPYFDIDRKQIAIRSGDDITIDLIQFEQNLKIVETHSHRQLAGCPTCLARLEEATQLVRGELLAGLNFPSDTWEAWLINQREYFQQHLLDALKWLCESKLILGEWTAVLEIPQKQLSLEPWQEDAHRAIMQAHVHLGDRNAALAQYELCEKILWEELGVEPEDETIELAKRIKEEGIGHPSSFSLHPSSFPNNLPLQTTPFFGREAEKAQLLERLVDPNYRLITLVGAGGIGKTRLATEVGQQVLTNFPDGVWFVPLDAVHGGAEQIKIAVGEVIGLGQDDKQLTGDQVIAILRDKRMLLIFDNSEPVLEEVIFIPQWLKRAPEIAILATSREPLNFQSESTLFLTGLPTGEDKISAAEGLFAERGKMARNDFEVTAVNLPQIRQICEMVGGSPLGIGLAAAWVRRRSLYQIIDELGRSLDILSTRMRDIDPRHRSMRAVFDTSWDLLDKEEQEILAALSVFPSTFTAVAAEYIAQNNLFDLDLLCEKSLLQQLHEQNRYLMHSLVRQFAAEKLAEQRPEVDFKFVDYFYQYAHAHQNNYPALQTEWFNFSASIVKAQELGAWQAILDMTQVLDEPWFRQIRFSDMRESLTVAIAAATTLKDQPALARSLARLGEIEIEQSDYSSADIHIKSALHYYEILEDGLGIAQGKYLHGRIHMEQSNDQKAISLCTESKKIFEAEKDRLGIAKNLNLLALCHIRQHRDFETAQKYLKESVELQKDLPFTSSYIEALRNLARVNMVSKNFEEATLYLIEATKIAEQQDNLAEYAAVLYEQLILNKRQGNRKEAMNFGYEAHEKFKQIGSLRWEALLKTQLGLLNQADQNFEQSLPLLKDGLDIFTELGDLYEQAHSQFYLYKLYDEMGDIEQSLKAKEAVSQINLELNDSRLTERLQDASK